LDVQSLKEIISAMVSEQKGKKQKKAKGMRQMK